MEGDIACIIKDELATAISIHALRVEGDGRVADTCAGRRKISIHALRVEGDWDRVAAQMSKSGFLSTPSGWRATAREQDRGGARRISIHALRVEGDFWG